MSGKPKRKKDKRNKYAFLNDVDIRDVPTINGLGIRAIRQLAKINNIRLPRTCTKRDEILYAIHTHTEKMYGKDYAAGMDTKPHVASEKLDQINEQIEKSVRKEKVDWQQAKNLCNMLCTKLEIRGFFGVTSDTLNRLCKTEFGIEWDEFYDLNTANGKIALRRKQMKIALGDDKASAGMLIHLGKTELGQVESKVEKVKPGSAAGALTIDSLVAFMSESGLVNKDVLKDTMAMENAFQSALQDDHDAEFKPVAKGQDTANMAQMTPYAPGQQGEPGNFPHNTPGGAA